jgi:predicted PhzF superfamily epimerase YddE/YHI9
LSAALIHDQSRTVFAIRTLDGISFVLQMFTPDKGVYVMPSGHAKVSMPLGGHALSRLAKMPGAAYLMGSPSPIETIAAVPPQGTTSHGREQ